MQILGLADSTPQPENRLKALLWPAIRHETDVDNVTRQGFWICFIIAVTSILFAGFLAPGVLIAGIFEGVFFFLSGVGVRMRSIFAAAAAFFVYFVSSIAMFFFSNSNFLGIGRIIFTALLLANLRGTWLSSKWRGSQTEPPPVPMNVTLLDKISDRLPIHVWPVGRFVYYCIAVVELGLIMAGLVGLLVARH